MGGNTSKSPANVIHGSFKWEYHPSRITDDTFHLTNCEMNHLMKHNRLRTKKKKKVRFDENETIIYFDQIPTDLQFLFLHQKYFQVKSFFFCHFPKSFLIEIEY